MTTAQATGVGRRKNAVARVYLREGSGKAEVNGRSLDDYFHSKVLRMIVRQPFEVTGTDGRFDYRVTVRGGGHAGQAGAIRLGLSRALLHGNESLRDNLRRAGLLTVDARKKERKKYGQKGARARFQFSKR